MSKNKFLVPSILDRLIDENPENKHELFSTSYQRMSEYLLSIQRDLQNLLNTRLPNLQWPLSWVALETSLFSYGIPDFTQDILNTDDRKNNFCRHLEKIITRFEPRLNNSCVTLLRQKDSQPLILFLRIEAVLRVESVTEKVVFESTI